MTLISVQGKPKTITTKDKEIVFSLHTIILLIGLDGSGKSNFAKTHLVPKIKSFSSQGKQISVVNIEQDKILETITDGQSKERTEFSYMAQKASVSMLESSARYPVSADFIILDCDAMDENFRLQVSIIAEDNGYKIHAFIFDLPVEEHFYIDLSGEKVQIKGPQKKKIRQLMSGQIQKEKYHKVDTITSRAYSDFSLDDYIHTDQFTLPDGPEYVLIGDIHGCLDEFKELLILNGFVIGEDMRVSHPEGKKVVLIGDLVDKGYDIIGVIEFAYANIGVFFMVLGNHESFVYRLLKKLASTKDSTPELRKEYFETYELLKEYQKPDEDKLYEKYIYSIEEKEIVSSKEDFLEEYYRENPVPTPQEIKRITEVREKFFAVVENMKSFFVHKDFIATHAPCESKHLGKINDASLKAARDFRYPKQSDFEDFSSFMYEFDLRTAYLRIEANDNYKFHIFGHVMTKEVSRFKNKICIDTGCVSGGKLSALTIKGKKITINHVENTGKTKKQKELFNFFQ